VSGELFNNRIKYLADRILPTEPATGAMNKAGKLVYENKRCRHPEGKRSRLPRDFIWSE